MTQIEKPKILINGVETYAGNISARLARDIMRIGYVTKEMKVVDYVDAICDVLSKAYSVSIDDILDNINVDELVKKHAELYGYTAQLLFTKPSENNVESKG